MSEKAQELFTLVVDGTPRFQGGNTNLVVWVTQGRFCGSHVLLAGEGVASSIVANIAIFGVRTITSGHAAEKLGAAIPFGLDPEVKAFAVLEVGDDLEQVASLGVARGAEHAHEALG